MRIALAALLVACSRPAPPPAKPPSQSVVRAPVSDVPTCADMGPLLRGAMDGDEDTEGPKKEALIIAACERDKWPASVLACAASATEPTVQSCVDELPEETQARYRKALEKYGSSRAHDDDDDAPPPEETSCADALVATDAWPPVVVEEAERSLAAKLRGLPLVQQCGDLAWDVAIRTCIASTPAAGIDACLAMFGDTRRALVDRVIKDADELRAKIVKARAKPANVSCAKVVAVHYAPAKWVGKSPRLTGAARKKEIEATKKAMLEHCTTTWTLDARACVVATDSDACIALGAIDVGWGKAPDAPLAPFAPTGIVECDEYGAAVIALSSCGALPEENRTAMLDAFQLAANAWKNLPAEALEAARASCAAARDATRQTLASCP